MDYNDYTELMDCNEPEATQIQDHFRQHDGAIIRNN